MVSPAAQRDRATLPQAKARVVEIVKTANRRAYGRKIQ
jgi:hypothetical protein